MAGKFTIEADYEDVDVEYIDPADVTVHPPNSSLPADRPKTPAKGVCKYCGIAVPGSRTVCDEHDGRRTKGATGRRNPANGGRKRIPTADDWTNKVFGKVLALLTILMATGMVNRRLRMPEGPGKEELIDRLAMSDQEAKDIARPFGRMFAGTRISKSHGHHVIDNLDIIDAGFAFIEWQSRVSTFINSTKERHLATVHDMPQRSDSERTQTEGDGNGNNESSDGQLGFQWDGNRGAGII